MKLHIWTDEVSYLAVCHADSVADAREMLALEVGGQDGSCPERAKAWKDISENTSALYNGRVAAFCLSDSAEVREQLAYSEKVCAERDAARASIAALEAELAEARKDGKRLAQAALAVINRWDSPKWKDQDPTAKVINELRVAIEAVEAAGEVTDANKG